MENRFVFIITKLKYVTMGMFFGLALSVLMSVVFSSSLVKNNPYSTENIKSDSELLLMRYIEGSWVSAIGDIVISITDLASGKGSLTFKSKSGRVVHYAVANISQIDGILGFVRMELCKTTSCNANSKIEIQINKLSGVKVPAIGIIYTSEFAECVSDKWCLRGFVENH